MSNSKFSFRWGVSLFDNARTEIPNLILEYYHLIPITNTEMMFIIHLASFKYETKRGKSRPSLTKTLRERMGYKSNQGIIDVEQSLVNKGLLIVHKIPGCRSEYDFTPFSEKILSLFQEWSAKIDQSNPSTKVDDSPSRKIDDQSSTKVDGSRQQKLTRRREEEKESKEEKEKKKKELPSSPDEILSKNPYFGIKLTKVCGYEGPQFVVRSKLPDCAAAVTQLLAWGATEAQLDQFGKYWWGRTPPSFNQVVEEWGKFLAWLNGQEKQPSQPAIKLNGDQLAAYKERLAADQQAAAETAARVESIVSQAGTIGVNVNEKIRELAKSKRV